MRNAHDSRRNILVVLLLTIAGALIRTYSTYNGGIWADEGLVFNIVAIPSWRDMFAFLGMHESHPPLFYVLVRAWRILFGSSDNSTLSVAVVLGAAIIPSTYLVARSLFSRRAALIAAALVAFSPSLIEHSAQLRPYGLLPILVLLSSWALTKAIEGARVRYWLGYAATTTLMLYTHHWTWLVWGGQFVAFAFVLFHSPPPKRVVLIRRFALSAAAIVALYSAWLPSFVFQVRHTGHWPLELTGAASYALFFVVGAGSIPSMLFVGGQHSSNTAVVVVSIALIAAVAMEMLRLKSSDQNDARKRAGHTRNTTVTIFLVTPAFSIAACLLLSIRSNMMYDRCLVMLTPLLLILLASWMSDTSKPGRAGLLAFITVLTCGGAMEIITEPRANTREVSGLLRSRISSGDLVVVSPEWLAPSFNHYFPPIVDQIDFPQRRRTLLLDFTGFREPRSDSAALKFVTERISEAKEKNRRVWLVTSTRYRAMSSIREMDRMLTASYGNADTSLFEHPASARYEQLLPFLFTTMK